MYTYIFEHKNMLADAVRVSSFQRAIKEVIQPGDVVVDIGAGSGLLSFFALQAGARKVYAIEQADIIVEAQRLAKHNGFEEKIEFIHGRSDLISLPERVDVIVSEIVGNFGLDEFILTCLADSQKRFLKPGGRMIPLWLELFIVPVQSDYIWGKTVGLWNDEFYGLDYSPPKSEAFSRKYIINCTERVLLLAEPMLLSHINLTDCGEVSCVFRGNASIRKNGTFHGLVGYHQTGLSPTVTISTSPLNQITSWSHNFFPLEQPISVKIGDTLYTTLKAIFQSSGLFWQWETAIMRGKQEIISFNQSNLRLDVKELAVGRASYKPVLSPKGILRKRVMDLCDGKRTVGDISRIVHQEFPDDYQRHQKAMKEVVRILQEQGDFEDT